MHLKYYLINFFYIFHIKSIFEKLNKKSRLSVIVPVYNIEREYIEKLINLFIIQPLKETEYILVDDKSTDGTGEYLDIIAKIDNRFTIIHKEKNTGISTSRNIGLNFVTSNYLTFTDDDDLFKINIYEASIKTMENDKSIDIIKYNTKLIYKGNENNIVVLNYNKPKLLYAIRNYKITLDLCCVVWDKIFKSEIIFNHNLYFPKTIIFEDGYFLNMILPYIKKIKYFKNFNYFWRQRKTSFSHTRSLNDTIEINSIEYCLPKVFENWKKYNVLENNCDLFYFVFRFNFRHSKKLHIEKALLIYKKYRKMFNNICISKTSFDNRNFFRKYLNEITDTNINKYEILIKNNICYY